jgi:mevalonate kinase
MRTLFFQNSVITATAPGKVILFGEHAINRGQPALSTAVGVYARCMVSTRADVFHFHSGTRTHITSREDITQLARHVNDWRAAENYDSIRVLAAADFFAPQKYILATAFGDALPIGLDLAWESEIPSSSGLGSGGAAFTAMVAAITPLCPTPPTLAQRASWAHYGDIIAHGGIASALDTQTSLLGGVIRYTGQGLAESVPCADGLCLVIGHTGVSAATSEVNSHVRRWLAENPDSRMAYFQTIGTLARTALPLLARGDWGELGKLFTLNQLVLEKIGVSCPEIDRLVEAALGAGAYGAKISGSGGGGIISALVAPDTQYAVAEAITHAGGTVFMPQVGVAGVRVESI